MNNDRRYPGESNRCRPDGASMRRREAEERQEAYNKLSAQEKIDRLNMKFGDGVGAKKERARLQKSPVQATVLAKDAKGLSDDAMREIEAMNDAMGKRKAKAKDRRSKEVQE